MEITFETAEKLGLKKDEFEKIVEILGRDPNFTELSAYSVMWSEHCSYKNSIKWLKTLPKEGSRLLVNKPHPVLHKYRSYVPVACRPIYHTHSVYDSWLLYQSLRFAGF